jgi:hypothetical protein
MTKEALAVMGFELREAGGNRALQVFEGPGCSLAQMGLELGEGHFDGV